MALSFTGLSCYTTVAVLQIEYGAEFWDVDSTPVAQGFITAALSVGFFIDLVYSFVEYRRVRKYTNALEEEIEKQDDSAGDYRRDSVSQDRKSDANSESDDEDSYESYSYSD